MRSCNFHVSQNVPTDSPVEVLITDAVKNEIHVSQVKKTLQTLECKTATARIIILYKYMY